MPDFLEIGLNYLIFVGLLLITVIFLYQTRKHARKAHELTLALFCGAIGQLFLTFGNFNQFNDERLALYVTIFGLFLFSLLFVFIFLHYEYEHRITPSPIWLSLLMLLVGSLILALWLVLINNDARQGLSFLETARFIFHGLLLFVFVQSFTISLMTSRRISERQQVIETLSLGVLLAGSIIYVIGDLFKEFFTNLIGISHITLGDVFIVFGVFTLVGNYLSNVDFLYRLPVPIYQIMLFNEAGVAVYSKRLRTRGLERTDIQDQLFASTVTAITSLIRETLGTESQLRMLDAKNKQIYLERVGPLTGLVITEQGTRFMVRSLKQLMDSLPRDLIESMNHSLIKPEDIDNTVDRFLKKAFPYVEFVSG